MIGRRLLLALLLGVTFSVTLAQELRPFVAGSHAAIREAHKGKAFVLSFWSLECIPCYKDLALFGKLLPQRHQLDLVLVATDTPAQSKLLLSALQRHGLERGQTWVFAERPVERLYFEIDRDWQGELPRTYLISADGAVRAISGVLKREDLERWIAAQ